MNAAGREIRARHDVDQLLDAGIGILDQMQRGVAQFGGIVRRDRGRHADRDAGRAVGQQVREGAGQDDRLVVLAVIGVAEIDRVLVDALEQQASRPRSGALRCSAWRRRYRRRYCRNCPARRPADSARRNPARGAPARRRSPGRHAGWYLPITSPTMRAHFLKPARGRAAGWRIAYSRRRWTGFSPSRTSGSARSMIVDSA